MLRHAIFALVLVGAAFAGGAAINGPGLAWLQRTFAGGPSIIVDGPQARAASRAPKQFPAAKAPPLALDFAPRGASPDKGPGDAQAQAPAPPDPAGSPDRADQPPLLPAPELAGLPSAAPRSGPTDPLPPLELPPDRPAAPKSDPVARLASAGGLDPAPAAARDWGTLRGRMKALGVSRYRIEGEAEGRVRFSCVIPVDGLRAVGHQFEAEGDDEYSAVEAALRRIALWRATEAK